MKAIHQNTSIIGNENLNGIYHTMLEHGDTKNADKILELYQKKEADEFIISFAGHFSAGKSSMINALLGSELLPKSPIPTSANIVKLTSGEGVARIFFHQEQPMEYDEPYDLDMIKEYCKDKDTIKQIQISSSQDIIPKNSAIVDTPGIDAADDTDRLITESSLHLVDVLFYVMDYNHVQSEVNLLFLKKIQAMNIPYFIIINQIDKHNENELSFAAFDSSVKQTFDQWGLTPESIYYSSLVEENASHNQLKEIKQTVDNLFREEHILRLDASVRNLLEEHKTFLKEQMDEEITMLSVDGIENVEAISKVESIKDAIETLENKTKDLQHDFIYDMEQTLKNAYLMPAEVRDKAMRFLESQQKDFKVGFLGAKRKTEEEKENRMHEFLTAINESMQVNIEWRLREKFGDVLKAYSIAEPQLLEKAQQLAISFNEDDITGLIKKGAIVNGDSVLHYTNDVSHAIKTKYRKSSRALLATIIEFQSKDSKAKIDEFYTELRTYQELLDAKEEYKQIKENFHNQVKHMEEQLYDPEHSNKLAIAMMQKLNNQVFRKGTVILEKKKMDSKENTAKIVPIDDLTNSSALPTPHQIVKAIGETINTIEGLPGFESIIRELLEKKERLDNRKLTIALFGAFSAGKSSLANALIGEGLLPSSPNPTTAVINRISPVTEEHKHGTVLIHVKDFKTLKQDLLGILKHFSPPEFDKLSSFIEWIKTNNIDQSQELSNMYQAYLQAVLRGYEKHKELIGHTRVISLEDFTEYVTDEAKACYIESIDLFYDCSITRKGITLVDTPGADSVNARHTNVAFDYIKNADAILYVTYYNHALTKADRDFVMQLGRVKESFQLDKMFFLINASDLAQDDTELHLVKDYVEDQLLKLGIRNPRLYPVSSKQALTDKMATRELNKQMADFEEEFYSFLENELSQIVIKSSIYDLDRTKNLFDHFIQKMNLDEQEKETYKADLKARHQELLATITKSEEGSLFIERIQQKITKQLHYVVERLGIRFHDMFKDKFNPTTVSESGRKAIRQLERNMVDLLDYMGYELLQEARAVSLRIESYMKEQSATLYTSFSNKLQVVDGELSLPAAKSAEFETPDYHQPLTDIDIVKFQKAFSLYKGTKAFFEKNEKEAMKEAIYNTLISDIEEYIKETNGLMDEHYVIQWNAWVDTMKNDLMEEINRYVESNFELLDRTQDMSMLVQKQRDLSNIMEDIK
ncbi:dynamin family protein [Ornithinibacillus xuwenensis]|uniref:Dynamin family protein n=1 Tax=Ornithinibacillus xuwenensis TaxID=3144668 RepID=A0ABU9XDI4_9BACI